jgi:hypothetical protein
MPYNKRWTDRGDISRLLLKAAVPWQRMIKAN